MLAVPLSSAVFFGQEIDEKLTVLGLLPFEPDRKPDLARLGIEVVHEQDRIVAPVVAHHEHGRIADRDHREVAPAHLGDFLAHADDPFSPVQERVRMTPLDRSIDVLETIGAARDDGYERLIALGEAAVRLVRPLHRRARAVALRKSQVVAHTEFVTVTEYQRARQREHQAVGELEPTAIAVEHGGEPPTNAAVVELHSGYRSERRKHLLPLPLREPSQVEFVMIAQ